MDSNTQMFIGFLIYIGCIFLPLIVASTIGIIVMRHKLKTIERELGGMDK